MIASVKASDAWSRRKLPEVCERTIVSSYGQAVILRCRIQLIIGERINPTGKKKFKQALKDHDHGLYSAVKRLSQQDHGAHILDVNVGLPDIDEVAMMREVVIEPAECYKPATSNRYS